MLVSNGHAYGPGSTLSLDLGEVFSQMDNITKGRPVLRLCKATLDVSTAKHGCAQGSG